MLRGSPTFGHTINYDRGDLCMYGGMAGGGQLQGSTYVSCFNALQRGCVHELLLKFIISSKYWSGWWLYNIYMFAYINVVP